MGSFSCHLELSLPPGIRLDRYIAKNLKLLTRSQIKARQLKAHINGDEVKLSRILKGGEFLELNWNEQVNSILLPEDLPLDIVYEDENVIVINKAQGMVVHPAAGNWQGTLANALYYRRLEKGKVLQLGDQIDPQSGLRPGIVHRLDKDTSGLLIAAWDEMTHNFLSNQFKARKVHKTYAAFVHGKPKNNTGIIDNYIKRSYKNRKIFTIADKNAVKQGRRSITHYRLVKCFGNYSLLCLKPKTGRTHQLRVHMKHMGIPILGDSLYGRGDKMFNNISLMLHSKNLKIVLPGQRKMSYFKSPLPQRFKEIINTLR